MKHAIITIGFPPEQGGLQESAYSLANKLTGEVTVFARFVPNCKEFDSKQKIEVIRYATGPLKELIFKGLGRLNPLAPYIALYKKSLKKWIAQNKPDIIHCFHINTAIIGHLAKKDFEIPYVIYCHGREVTPPYLAEKKIFSKLARSIFENADQTYCASEVVQEFVVPFVTRQDKIKTIPIDATDTNYSVKKAAFQINQDIALIKQNS